MSTNLHLFQKEILTFKEKFYILMDLLISNQNPSRIESIMFIGIYHIQIISGFFSQQIGIFKKDKYNTDKILYYIQKISRFKDILINKYSNYRIFIFFFLILIFLFIIYFSIICSKIKQNSFYSYHESIINYLIKVFNYICFNIILDLIFLNFCFGNNNNNPFFENISCNIKDHLDISLISIFLFIVIVFVELFIQFFYCDSIYISISFYSRINSNYELFLCLNSICYSFLLIQINFFSKELFLIYNITTSTLLFKFYLNNYIYYDKITNNLVGLFHILYLWTSYFTFLFLYLNFKEIGMIYLISSIMIMLSYFNIKAKIEQKIIFKIPYYQITNKNHLLFYIKNIIDKINNMDENPIDKNLMSGILYIHSLECPNDECISKKKKKLYLPITNEWSDKTKPNIEDKVYLFNFIIIIMNYVISLNHYSPDMIINLSLYYIDIIGNFCQAIYYYKLVKGMKLTFQERISFERLKIKISKSLIEKCKSPNEPCTSLEDLDVTLYFKYEELSQNFIDEINNDIHLSLDFWKILRNAQLDSHYQINFNKLFHLIAKIRIKKKNIEKLWDKLFSIYHRINDLFYLYSEYVEQIIDDDLKKRDLENIRKKNENFTEPFLQNYYSMLFDKETGIIIANGDKGKIGIIEKTNEEVENIFKYKANELKGMNVSSLIPKNFSSIHNTFIEKYSLTGEKIIIDKKCIQTFGIDKDSYIIMLKIAIKLFPILNENLFFIGIFTKENVDDIIYIDDKFEIQGMSMKLMKNLKINNNLLFQDNDIPFYVICKQFINFYKIVLQKQKTNYSIDKEKKNSMSINSYLLENLNESFNKKETLNSENNELNENIEINENIELEYEICLPKFFTNFLQSMSKKKNNDIENGEIIYDEKENFGENETIDEYDESSLFINNKDNENINSVERTNNKNEQINNNSNYINNTPNSITPKGIIPIRLSNTTLNRKESNRNLKKKNSYKEMIKRISLSVIGNSNILNLNKSINRSRIEFFKRTDEEKEFNYKIQKYKELFNSGQFKELEELIDLCNIDTTLNKYKFNFSFEKYKFGKNNISYAIRCVDNKNKYSNSDVESNENLHPKIINYKKEKIKTIKPLYEIIEEEKENILNQVKNFSKLLFENENFQNLLVICKNDIHKMSMVHGTQKEEIQDDENASQASQSEFNSDLVKKNKIEELRGKILNNISNFYILKYIKLLAFLISLCTIIFGVIYLFLFLRICNDLKIINKLNIILYQITIWTTNLVGTLVSLKSLINNNKNNNYNYNSYIEKNKYFTTMKKFCYIWYNNITIKFGELEHKIGKYLNEENYKTYFWDEEQVNYNFKDLANDTETFPLELSQIMSNINSLLLNPYFNLHSNFSENILNYLGFISFSSIENAYDNLIPNQLIKILKIPLFFQDYNSSSRKILIKTLFFYFGLMVILSVLYLVLLHLMNVNMSEGIEKISKIKLEKIDETLQKIEVFNLTLKKIKDKDNQTNNDNKYKEKTFNEGTKLHNTNFQDSNFQNNNFENLNEINSQTNYSLENKKSIPLQILSFSYFKILILFSVLCSFLIPIYLIINSMVIATNKIIDFEDYMIGDILKSSVLILKIKCKISECNIKNELDYSILNQIKIPNIPQTMNIFKDFNFYDYDYMYNACKCAYDENTEEYNDCINNDIIKSANNTETLLKIIKEFVDYLENEIIINKNNNNYILSNGSIVSFRNIYVYETNYFQKLETIYYKFIAPVTDKLSKLYIKSLSGFLKYNRNLVVLLIIFFCIIIISLCLYISFFFIKKLIRLLSISRFILKIIPTFAINTEELETWIEN